jgi:hypothetical protein
MESTSWKLIEEAGEHRLVKHAVGLWSKENLRNKKLDLFLDLCVRVVQSLKSVNMWRRFIFSHSGIAEWGSKTDLQRTNNVMLE